MSPLPNDVLASPHPNKIARRLRTSPGLKLLASVAESDEAAAFPFLLDLLSDAQALAGDRDTARHTWHQALQALPADTLPDDRRKAPLEKKRQP